MVFVLLFVDVVDDVDGFLNVVPSLHPWGESHLVMVYDPFDVFLNSVCEYFVEYFCMYVHQGYWAVIFFLVASLPGFAIRVMLAS